MQDPTDQLRLARAEGVGPVTWRRLLARYRDATTALRELPRLARGAGRVPVIPDKDVIAREIEATHKLGGRFIFQNDPLYPPLLANLDDAPPCLVARGDAALLTRPAIAAVGGRNASANGQRMAETLCADLARQLVVVSGLARGIDAAAHRGALRTGRTVAAIAGGIDHAYPPENAALQDRIAAEGALVTEAAFGTEPQARHFPRRNRVIAGLALGVVVIEAAPRSGSLITARIAQDAGREVFAVPGSPLDPRARGGNDLIRQGATLVETVADVLDNLPDFNGFGKLDRRVPTPTTEVVDAADPPADLAVELLALLSPEGTQVDDLVRRCQFSSSAVLAALLELELAGRVRTLPGNRVALSAEAA
jgi:DNA processing protein